MRPAGAATSYANNFFTTFPLTSVNRKSRPRNRYVRFVLLHAVAAHSTYAATMLTGTLARRNFLTGCGSSRASRVSTATLQGPSISIPSRRPA